MIANATARMRRCTMYLKRVNIIYRFNNNDSNKKKKKKMYKVKIVLINFRNKI